MKITIFGEEHHYVGERTIDKILGFVKNELSNLNEKKKNNKNTNTIKYVEFSD